MDFVSGRPLSEHPGGAAGLARALGALISKVQATPPFPMLGTFPEVIGSVLAGLSKSSFFATGQLDRHAEGLARISRPAVGHILTRFMPQRSQST